MICVSRLPSPLWDQEPDWDLGMGLGLAQYIACHNNYARTSANDFLPPTWPPPTSLRTAHALSIDTNGDKQRWNTEEIYQSKNKAFRRIKQGLDRNWTKIGRPKVTDIYYNTVAHFYLVVDPLLVVRLITNINTIHILLWLSLVFSLKTSSLT